MSETPLPFRPEADCQWDILALGEVMLRFDPGEGRIRNSRTFQVWEGGGEYNLARAARKCFGLRASIATALPRNDIGALTEDLILQGGVDTSNILWREFDGIGRNTRVGLNFVERGFGIRPALGVSDRGHSAASQMQPGDIDWDQVFGTCGVRWFHTGGIFAALSDSTTEMTLDAIEAARRHGTLVSYDLNYRPSLWAERGGSEGARALNRRIAAHVDILFGADGLGTPALTGTPKDVIESVRNDFPNLKVIATTTRKAHTANINDWQGFLWAGGDRVHASRAYDGLDILDRVGGGDAFASGIAYGLLTGKPHSATVEYGTAHGALAMTTPGDASMASLAEVERALENQDAGVIR